MYRNEKNEKDRENEYMNVHISYDLYDLHKNKPLDILYNIVYVKAHTY